MGYIAIFLVIAIGGGVLEVAALQNAAPFLISATGPLVFACIALNLYAVLARRRK